MIEEMKNRLEQYERYMLDDGNVEAAVLVALTLEDSPHVLLTLRAAHLKRYPGQVAFPGGRVDPSDASYMATALRESHEEIALLPADVTVLKQLSTVRTRDDTRVIPFIAVVPHDVELCADPSETESVFRVPMAFLADPKNFQIEEIEAQGQVFRVPFFQYQDHRIWGMTARILMEVVNILYSGKLRT